MKEEESNSLYSSTLKLALQALCLPLPRFCADIMSHPRGCISDATTSMTRTPNTALPCWSSHSMGGGMGGGQKTTMKRGMVRSRRMRKRLVRKKREMRGQTVQKTV